MHNQLKELRLQHNLNQKQMADKIGTSQNTLSRAENGVKISQDLLNLYNDCFGTNFVAPLKKCETCDNLTTESKRFCNICVKKRNYASLVKYKKTAQPKSKYVPVAEKKRTERENKDMLEFSKKVVSDAERLARENRKPVEVIIPQGAKVLQEYATYVLVRMPAGYRDCINI